MRPSISVIEVRDNSSQLARAMRALTGQDVFIGIPEDKTAREEAGDTGISNAYIGYIHEHGVPEKNIPAREHLIPGVQDIQDEAVKLLEHAAKQALEGKPEAVGTALNKIGLLGQEAVQARFVNNEWEPLADSTLDYQALRKNDQGAVLTDKKGNPLRKESRRERERTNPLIDTSQLRKAYTYVVRKRGQS